jgi:hypothetical protein
MTTHIEQLREVSPRSAREEINEIEARMRRWFAAEPQAVINEIVQARYHAFDDATIREYIPVLVEHAVRNDLAARAARAARS